MITIVNLNVELCEQDTCTHTMIIFNTDRSMFNVTYTGCT